MICIPKKLNYLNVHTRLDQKKYLKEAKAIFPYVHCPVCVCMHVHADMAHLISASSRSTCLFNAMSMLITPCGDQNNLKCTLYT